MARRTKAQQYAVETAKRNAKRAAGICALCPKPSPDHYWCKECRDKRNARNARNKALAKRREAARIAARTRDHAIGLAS